MSVNLSLWSHDTSQWIPNLSMAAILHAHEQYR